MKCPYTNCAVECTNAWCVINVACAAYRAPAPDLLKQLVITLKPNGGWTMTGYAPKGMTVTRSADGTTIITLDSER